MFDSGLDIIVLWARFRHWLGFGPKVTYAEDKGHDKMPWSPSVVAANRNRRRARRNRLMTIAFFCCVVACLGCNVVFLSSYTSQQTREKNTIVTPNAHDKSVGVGVSFATFTPAPP